MTAAVNNSIMLRFFILLRGGARGVWRGSVLRRILCRAEAWLRRTLPHSAVFRFLWRDGALPRAWPDSLCCRALSGLLSLPCTLLDRLYRRRKGLWDGSALFRALDRAGSAPALLTGLVVLVMLAAPHDYWNNVYGLLGAVAATALFILGAARRPGQRPDCATPGPYLLPYGLCILAAFLGSPYIDLSVRFFLFHATALLLILLTVSSVSRYEQLRLMVALATAGLAVASLYGCLQGIVGVPIDPSQQDAVLNAWMTNGRVYSFFDNPNNFAEILLMLLPLNAALLINAESARERLYCGAALAVGLISMGLTLSRSSWIGLAVAVVVFIFLVNWRMVPVLLILGLAALPLLPDSVYNRIMTMSNLKADTSTLYRLFIYEAVFDLLKDYWVRGAGLGTDALNRAFQAYPPLYNGLYPLHAHNNYLEVWAELGIAGILSFLALLWSSVKTAVKQFRRTADRRVRLLLGAAVGGLCGIMVTSLAEYTWYYPRNMFVYWFLFGVVLACIKLGRQERAAGER